MLGSDRSGGDRDPGALCGCEQCGRMFGDLRIGGARGGS